MTSHNHVDDGYSAGESDEAVLEALERDLLGDSSLGVAAPVEMPPAAQPVTPTRTRRFRQKPSPQKRLEEFTWNQRGELELENPAPQQSPLQQPEITGWTE